MGIYSRLQVGNLFGNDAITFAGVLSDEMIHSGSFPTIAEMDINDINSANITSDDIWVSSYTGIYQANIVIEALDNDTEYTGLTDALRTQYLAEARFLRAFFHFVLANYYGDIPIITTSDLATNSEVTRDPRADVYALVISEASQAASDLAGVDFGSNAQFRVGEWAAKALQARALLYSGDASGAAAVADDIIENGGFSLEPSYGDLFQPGPAQSDEIIWGLFFSGTDQSGLAFQFLPDGRFEFAVSPQLQAAVEAGDERALWEQNAGDSQGRFYTTKYTDVATGTDGTIIFRLAEMHLIRAEGNLGTSQALSDINALRSRAGVSTKAGNMTIDDVLEERFVELSFEGHRWFDIARTGQADAIMSAINPSTWESTDVLLPIPNRDIQQNRNLTQNDGY